MKKHLSYFVLIIMLANACSPVVDITKKETTTKPKSFQYYKDKIAILNFENENLTESDSIKNKIANEISASSKQNFDAVIFNANNFSRSMLTSSNAELSFLNILRFAGDLAHSNGLDFFIEINFDELNRLNFPLAQNVAIKNNFNKLVKNCEFDGFYFSGINISSKDEINQTVFVHCIVNFRQHLCFI